MKHAGKNIYDFFNIASKINISGLDIVYAGGVFELLVGASVFSNIFIKPFSILAIVFLTMVLFTFGISEILVRDVGLIGGFLALIFWPERRRFI